MRNSEILLALMECAFEGKLPDDAPSLRECMRLYNSLREEENRANQELCRVMTESIRKSMGIEASKSYGFRPIDAAFVTVDGPSGTPAPTEGKTPETPEPAEDGAPGSSLPTGDGMPEESDTTEEAAEPPDTHTHTHTHGRAGGRARVTVCRRIRRGE